VDSETRRHRALAEPTRRHLLLALRSSRGPLSVDELAAELSVHPNTVRAHLDVLLAAELVVSTREITARPGRPRRLFAAPPDDAEREHALLAAALASTLEPRADGPALAQGAGRQWGHTLIERLEPGVGPTAANCIGRVNALLARRGFAPEEHGEAEIVMRRCPFRELAERYPRVICALHSGIIEGALDELGAPLEVERLQPWATPDTCVAHLRPRT
jgi:predicted ArsR family transcriptional regulator